MDILKTQNILNNLNLKKFTIFLLKYVENYTSASVTWNC